MLTSCSNDLTLDQWKKMLVNAKLRINKPNAKISDFKELEIKSYYVTQVGFEQSSCLSLSTFSSKY